MKSEATSHLSPHSVQLINTGHVYMDSRVGLEQTRRILCQGILPFGSPKLSYGTQALNILQTTCVYDFGLVQKARLPNAKSESKRQTLEIWDYERVCHQNAGQ